MLELGCALGGAATAVFDPAPVEPPFSPLDLSPVMMLDVSDLSTLFQDAAATVPVVADGDPVGHVADLSGNGFHLTASGTDRPVYRTDGTRHWLQAGNSRLSIASRLTLGVNPDLTIAAACNPEVLTGSWEALWHLGTETATGTLIGTLRDSGTGFLHANGNRLFSPLLPDADRVVSWRRQAGSGYGAQELFLDGLEEAVISEANPDNTPADTGAGFQLFDRVIGGQPFTGRLYGLAVFAASLPDRGVSDVAAWMAAKQGRTIPQDTHVFALMGQSNMVGQAADDGGEGWPAETQQYTQAGDISVPVSRLDHYSTSLGGGMPSIGLGFARAYAAANPAVRVLLVPCAAGGSGFADNSWNPGDGLYTQTVARLNAVMAENPDFQLKGLLWHQGERDGILNASATYQAKLTQFVTSLRSDVTAAAANTPFVCGGLLPSFTLNEVPQIQTILADAPNFLEHCGYASSATATTALDDRHFDAPALRGLGAEYFQAYLAALSDTPA